VGALWELTHENLLGTLILARILQIDQDPAPVFRTNALFDVFLALKIADLQQAFLAEEIPAFHFGTQAVAFVNEQGDSLAGCHLVEKDPKAGAGILEGYGILRDLAEGDLLVNRFNVHRGSQCALSEAQIAYEQKQ
jgi:hypothetical protein